MSDQESFEEEDQPEETESEYGVEELPKKKKGKGKR